MGDSRQVPPEEAAGVPGGHVGGGAPAFRPGDLYYTSARAGGASGAFARVIARP